MKSACVLYTEELLPGKGGRHCVQGHRGQMDLVLLKIGLRDIKCFSESKNNWDLALQLNPMNTK